MPDYPKRLQELLETLALTAADLADRANVLLSFADRFRGVPPEIARRPFSSEHRIPSCESEAYVWGVPQPDGTLKLHFAVENPSGVSARALAVILDETLSGLPPAQIATVRPEIVYDIFRRDISMGKGMGLMSMVAAVHAIALRALRRSVPTADVLRFAPAPNPSSC